MREARGEFVAALRDPAMSAQDLIALSGQLEPFSAFDPAAFVVFKTSNPASGRPLCGGPAEVPKVLADLNPRGGAASGYWIGTSTDLAYVLPSLETVVAWPWKEVRGLSERKTWKFGSMRMTMNDGTRFKMRLPAYQLELVHAMHQRFG